jgi:RimJ/RimL family protein N-acetyltransferase
MAGNNEKNTNRGLGFALVTDRLLVVPTPRAVTVKSYRALYASLHANKDFCRMGFGDDFPVQAWTDEETIDVVTKRDIQRCWAANGLGDFAVALRHDTDGRDLFQAYLTALLAPSASPSTWIIEGSSFDALLGSSSGSNSDLLDGLAWVGYAGVRDGPSTSMPARTAELAPLPPREELVELRYGVAPEFWGRGVAKEAADAVMLWASARMGVRRFVAETELDNSRSGRVLEKMGFSKLVGTDYWQNSGEQEWAKPAPTLDI